MRVHLKQICYNNSTKLSVKKLEDKTTKMEDEIIPCNQEAVYLQEDDELD